MNLNELDTTVVETQLVWARKGRNLVRKYRCVVGQRAGRLVSNCLLYTSDAADE